MTYKKLVQDLITKICDNPDIANQDATLYDSRMDEFFPVTSLEVQKGDDTLDDGHLYLQI